MSRRSKLGCLASLLFGLALFPLAGAASAAEDASDSPMQPGAWALQFSIGENFQLESFGGAAIAVKRHTSANGAWRAGFALNARMFEFEEELLDSLVAPERELDAFEIDLDLDRMHYFGSAPRMHPYVAFGPRVTVSNSSVDGGGGGSEFHLLELGVGGVLGIEYQVIRSLGIHGEYRQQLGYSSNSREAWIDGPAGRETINHQESSGWSFSNAGVRFGVSAYF